MHSHRTIMNPYLIIHDNKSLLHDRVSSNRTRMEKKIWFNKSNLIVDYIDI